MYQTHTPTHTPTHTSSLIRNISALLGFGLAAAAGSAGSVVSVAAPQYRFLFGDGVGSTVYQANHDAQGIPKAMDLVRQPVSAELMDRINLALPERKDVRISGAAAMVADSESSTLKLLKDADVWVTFLHEGAGYRNAFIDARDYLGKLDDEEPPKQDLRLETLAAAMVRFSRAWASPSCRNRAWSPMA